MSEFHFIRPAFLLCLLPVLWVLWRKPGQQGWSDILPGHLSRVLVTSEGVKKSLAIPALIWILMSLALAGPTWKKIHLPVYQLHQGTIIIADMTLSMYATDVTPDRLTRARYKIIDLLGAIKEGDVGLVAYSGDAFVISPLTPDRNNIVQLLPALSPEIMPSIGSNPVAALALAEQLLKDSGHSAGDIYWITDGIHIQNQARVKDWISQSNYSVSALVIGTESGAPIRLPNGALLKDAQGNIVVPKIDMIPMQDAITSGQLLQQTGDNQDITSLVSGLVVDRKQSEAQREGDQWQDFGPYLVLVILPLFVWFFRRGGVFFLLPLMLMQPEAPLYADTQGTAMTAAKNGFTWSSLFSNQNQKASDLFKANQYSEAATTFSDPEWRASSSYKAGDYQQALELYQSLASSKEDAELFYNMGNTLAKLGQLDEAIKAYDQALKQQPNHADAIANKALLENIQSEQQSNQESSNEGQDSDSQSQDDQNQSQNDQGQQKNNSEDAEAKSGQQSPSDNESQPDSSAGEESSNQESEQSTDNEQAAQQNEARQTSAAESEETSAANPGSSVETPFEDLTPEEQQRMNQLMNQVTDDPSLLLRNKMLLNYQQRQQNQGQTSEDTVRW